jgi:hypothetical protein
MHPAAVTQPLATPWRRAAVAARLHVHLERVASLVVEDHRAPVPRLDARVFEIELVARLALIGADGRTLERRTIAAAAGAAEDFAQRVIDAVSWATELHPGLAVLITHAPTATWSALRAALPETEAQIAQVAPTELHLDRRPRVS